MDKIKLTQKEFKELYEVIEEASEVSEVSDVKDKPEEEFLTEEELAQDKLLEEI